MHIIVDVHSLPGGINGLTIGEATGHWGWYYNDCIRLLHASRRCCHLLRSVLRLTPTLHTIEPINKPTDKPGYVRLWNPAALSDHAAAWVLKYICAVMFQESFKQEQYWRPAPRQCNLGH